MIERDLRKERNRIQRERQLQKRFRRLKVTLGTCALVLVLSFTIGGIVSHAESDKAVHSYKYYTSILVYGGDTLWSIANTYKGSAYASSLDYIREVKQINHLTGDDLQAGDYLIVPYYSTEFVQ